MVPQSRSLTGEPTPQQALAARLLWFGQTIGSSLMIAIVMLQVLPGMDLKLPTIQVAPREVLVGGVVVLGAVLLMVGKHLRGTLFAPTPPSSVLARMPTGDDPVVRALQRLNANSALVGGLLDAPFLIGVALYMLDRDPWLIYAGLWVPLLGGAMLWPDPVGACRELIERERMASRGG